MSFRGNQAINWMKYVLKLMNNGVLTDSSPIRNIFIGKKDPVTGLFLPNKNTMNLIEKMQTPCFFRPVPL